MSNVHMPGNAGVSGTDPRPLQRSRREFLELTLATAVLAAPLTAGGSMAGASGAGPSPSGSSAADGGASAAASVRDQALSPADRLEAMLDRYGSELGHLTTVGQPKRA